jgi:hypothetical protein
MDHFNKEVFCVDIIDAATAVGITSADDAG